MIKIYETPYGKIKLNVDTQRLTIRLSSGFDSALLFYLIAKAASEHNPDVTIYPVTARRINSTDIEELDRVDNYANACRVTEWVRSEFPNLDIRDNILYNADFWWYCDDDPIVGQTHSYVLSQMIPTVYLKRLPGDPDSERTYVYIGYNGVTKNPDFELAGWNPERRRNLPDPRADDEFLNVVYFNDGRGFECEPWRNADKRITFWLADHEGILDKVLEISRSCEGERDHTDNWTKECHRCWWCYERKWAHETFSDPDLPVDKKYLSTDYFHSFIEDDNATV